MWMIEFSGNVSPISKESQDFRSLINAKARAHKRPVTIFVVRNADGMYLAKYHNEALAYTVATRLGGSVHRETVLE